MAKSNKKQDSTETNKIDELNEKLTNAGQKIAQNKKKYGWIIAAVLIVASLVCGLLFWWLPMYRASSAKLYAKAEQTAYYNTKKALNNVNPEDSAFINKFNDNLLAEYEKIIKSEGNKPGGNQARIAAAEMYYDKGEYKKTIEYLDKVKVKEPMLKGQLLILKGDSYVNLNNLGEAMKCYDECLKESKDYPMVSVRALLKKALVFDAQQKYGDALAVYKQIKKDYPREMEELSLQSVNSENPNMPDFDNAFTIDAFIAREEARLGK